MPLDFGAIWSNWMATGLPFYAGFLIPAVLALIALAFYPREIWSHRNAMLMCIGGNAVFALYQTYPDPGWHGGGLELKPLFALAIILTYFRHKVAMQPLVAFGCSWLSLLPPDMLGCFVQYFRHESTAGVSLLVPVTYLGGSGLYDALLLYPLFCVVVALGSPPFADWALPQSPFLSRMVKRYVRVQSS